MVKEALYTEALHGCSAFLRTTILKIEAYKGGLLMIELKGRLKTTFSNASYTELFTASIFRPSEPFFYIPSSFFFSSILFTISSENNLSIYPAPVKVKWPLSKYSGFPPEETNKQLVLQNISPTLYR